MGEILAAFFGKIILWLRPYIVEWFIELFMKIYGKVKSLFSKKEQIDAAKKESEAITPKEQEDAFKNLVDKSNGN